MVEAKGYRMPKYIQFAMAILGLSFFFACGGKSESKKEIEAQKSELEKVEIEAVQISQTPSERRVKVQTKGQSRALSIASQPEGVECEGTLWNGKEGKCFPDVDHSSGASSYWNLLIRKDATIRIGFLVTGCEKGIFMKSCESETVYKDLFIKGPQ